MAVAVRSSSRLCSFAVVVVVVVVGVVVAAVVKQNYAA